MTFNHQIAEKVKDWASRRDVVGLNAGVECDDDSHLIRLVLARRGCAAVRLVNSITLIGARDPDSILAVELDAALGCIFLSEDIRRNNKRSTQNGV